METLDREPRLVVRGGWRRSSRRRPRGQRTTGQPKGPANPPPRPRQPGHRGDGVPGQCPGHAQVDVPEGKGLIEIVVTPLPAQTVDSSLYAEGTDGLRVLCTPLPHPRRQGGHPQGSPRQGGRDQRTRKLEAERLKKEVQVIEQNLQLLTKLENFTGATMQHLAEKGLLNSEATLSAGQVSS